jgi:hypothetical protein
MSVCGGTPTDRGSLVGGCVRLEVAGDLHPDIIYYPSYSGRLQVRDFPGTKARPDIVLNLTVN